MTDPPAATQVRERLFAAAVELIPERGWSAVSTRILAERAGVSPSVVHYHFRSVQVLLVEAVTTAVRQMMDDADQALHAATTPVELVDALAGSVTKYSGADPLSLLFVEAYLAGTRDDVLREQLSTLVGEFSDRLARRLSDLEVADPSATAAVLAASIDGILLHRGLGAEQAGLAEVLRRLVS